MYSMGGNGGYQVRGERRGGGEELEPSVAIQNFRERASYVLNGRSEVREGGRGGGEEGERGRDCRGR